MNDIVIFFKIKKEHERHLREIFEILTENNISIKSTKAFIDYSFVSLLKQKIDSFDLTTTIEKLKTIAKFRFFRILRQLKAYLELTEWLRDYIINYVDISKSLQDRKTKMLRHESIIDNARRFYFFKTRLNNFTKIEIVSYKALQAVLIESFYFVYVNVKRSLFIDFDVSKKFDIDVMLYYVKKDVFKTFQLDFYSFKHAIESILFLSRLITSVEFKYWSTKLKIVGIVWILKKIRHIIEASSNKTVIYIDYDFVLEIAF